MFPHNYSPTTASTQVPNLYMALVDTGASCTCLSPKIVSDLALNPIGKQTVAGVHGRQAVNQYQFHVGILFGQGAPAPTGTVNVQVVPILATGVEFAPSGNFDVLLGRDILCQGAFSMTFDGHAVFSL